VSTNFSVFIDFARDNSFATAGDNITQWVREVPMYMLGMYGSGPLDRVAATGNATLVLDNQDRRFSPDNAAGPLYGTLLPGLPVKIMADANVIFYGYVMRWAPVAGAENPVCVVDLADQLYKLQSNTVALPLQENKSADYLIKLITSHIWGTAAGTGQVYLVTPANNDTLTVGTQVYRFVTALAQSNDVLIGDTYDATATNLADAINTAPEKSGTTYHASTTKHADVSGAVLRAGTGYDDSYKTSEFTLQGASGTTQIKLAMSFQVPVTQNVAMINLYLRKRFSPVGTATLRIETDSAGLPSGTLAHANATVNFAESGLTDPIAWKTLSFTPFSLTANTTYHLVLSTTRVWDGGTDYISWGADEVAPMFYKFGLMSLYNGAAWSAEPSASQACFEIGAVVEVAALAHGAWGNSIALTTTSGSIALSAATLTGGIDGPASMIDYSPGIGTFDVAADNWTENETNGLAAVGEVCQSEFAFFYAASDGTLVFRPWSWYFERANAAASLTLLGTHVGQAGDISLDQVFNRIIVNYTPRSTLATGVIAKSSGEIRVEGKSGITRWNRTYDKLASGNDIPWAPAGDLRPAAASDTVVHLPYLDQVTGRISGARAVVTPVKVTDFRCFDQPNSEGFEYTSSLPLTYSMSVVADGSGIDVAIKNSALGALYFVGLQARGEAIISFDQQQASYSSADSIALYGTRVLDYEIPLATTQEFAEGLALWLLISSKNPTYRISTISFRNQDTVAGVDIYSLDIGDVIAVTEDQTGVSAKSYLILGITGSIYNGGLSHSRDYTVLSFEGRKYWTLDDPVNGVIDSIAVLGM